MIAHGGLIALRIREYWRGVMIEGPSGAGKSDLALRALEAGFRLVADDRIELWTSAGRLFGRAPPTLAGRIEVRGLDVIETCALPFAQVALVARCGPAERMPDPAFAQLLGVSTPLIQLDPLEASAPAKLRRALSHFDEPGNRRI
ncbi:MAG: HPr kinase/phosphorylase [Caulobacteraceae bacterium]